MPRVLTLSGLGIPPKRYIKDGDAECLILGFNTISLLVMEGVPVRYFLFGVVYIDGSSPRM